MIEFKLKTDYIELIQLLKATGISQTGGHAKLIVEEGKSFVNGKKEFRKRAKLRVGDTVEIFNKKIRVV